ncbi:MAG: hypothetical protein M3Y57_20530 [Acidobacteriota bacterium]|nr:hypothetical protein [Acidobacteriota bacterium]
MSSSEEVPVIGLPGFGPIREFFATVRHLQARVASILLAVRSGQSAGTM